MNHTKKKWNYCKDLLLITLLAALLYGTFLGNRILSVPDEARYAEIPREMIAAHNYLIPRINGVKYFEKPPLFYWMQSGSIKLFGFNNWALRFSTAFLALIGLIATYIFTRNFYNRKTAWFAASILASMPLYFAMAHVITLDMSVSVWITISLFSCYSAIKNKSNSQRRLLMWTSFCCAAAAVLTKGLVGLIIPCAVFGLWFLLFNQWKMLKKLFLPSSIFIFLIIASPWHILVQLEAPEFFSFYFLDQQLFRYTTMISHRYQPFWFYIPVMLLGAAPWIWIVFSKENLKSLISSFKNFKKKKNDQQFQHKIFLAIWALFVLLFFSLSHSKLIPYIIPALPPLAILLAQTITSSKKTILTLAVTITVLFIAQLNADHFNKDTIKPLADALNKIIKPGDKVITYQHYYQDLPVYLKQKVIVFQSFNELTFGTKNEDDSAWMLTNLDDVMKMWTSTNTAFLIIDKNKYQTFIMQHPNNPGKILAQSHSDYLVTNEYIEKKNNLKDNSKGSVQ